MSDDDEGREGGEKPAKEKGVDLADLSKKLKAQGYDSTEDGAALRKTMEDIQRQMKPLYHLQDQMNSLHQLAEHSNFAAKLAEQSKRYSAVQEEMLRVLEPYHGLQERMKSLALSAGEDSAVGRIAKQIADQQRAIESMRPHIPENFAKSEPLRLPDIDRIKIPPNPILETNKRLECIGKRFVQMQDIATDAAQIANGLQGAAAEFLQKFETAAADNDRTAGRAIRIGIVAVIIAIAMPAVQIAYSEFRRAPDSNLEIQSALEDVQAELTRLREYQAEASVQIEEVINSSDEETTAILRDIRDLLSERAAVPAPAPDALPQQRLLLP